MDFRQGNHSKFVSAGGPGGSLGYPIASERCVADACAQSYQRGDITWAKSGARLYGMTECHKLNNGQAKYSTYGANRVLLTWTQDYGMSQATNLYCKNVAGAYVPDWRTDGYVGKSGFKRPGVPSGPTRNLYSPTGSFSVTEAFGLGNPGTKLSYRTLNPRSRWGGNPWTPTYNKYSRVVLLGRLGREHVVVRHRGATTTARARSSTTTGPTSSRTRASPFSCT